MLLILEDDRFMADKVEIEVIFNPDGTVEMDAKGYKGEMCLAEMEDLIKNVGSINEQKNKPEQFDKRVEVERLRKKR